MEFLCTVCSAGETSSFLADVNVDSCPQCVVQGHFCTQFGTYCNKLLFSLQRSRFSLLIDVLFFGWSYAFQSLCLSLSLSLSVCLCLCSPHPPPLLSLCLFVRVYRPVSVSVSVSVSGCLSVSLCLPVSPSLPPPSESSHR